MLPHTKQVKNLIENSRRAREGIKKARVTNGAGTSLSVQENPVIALLVHPAIHISDSSSDATYDVEQEIADSAKLRLEHFVEDWILSLSCDNPVSLAVYLCQQLEQLFGFTATNTADYVSVMLEKYEYTSRQWRSYFLKAGEIRESKQVCYQRTGILWLSKDRNRKAFKYVREISWVKGQPNLIGLFLPFPMG